MWRALHPICFATLLLPARVIASTGEQTGLLLFNAYWGREHNEAFSPWIDRYPSLHARFCENFAGQRIPCSAAALCMAPEQLDAAAEDICSPTYYAKNYIETMISHARDIWDIQALLSPARLERDLLEALTPAPSSPSSDPSANATARV